jgi:Carboxypeptidase regulatory-like domain
MRINRGYIVVVAALAASAMALGGPGGGTIAGKVTYTGTPPKMKPIDMSKEPTCAKEHTTPVLTETVVTGPGNTLENVVVYISAGATDGGAGAPPQPLKYDQKGCQYIPHVLAVKASEDFKIYNDDPVAHNIHPLPKANPEWNKSQPPGTPPIDAKWDKPEFIPVKCNIHPWMHGNYAVVPTSHYGISENGGAYKIANLPPGKYTLTAWHEAFGTQTQEVTIAGAETKTADWVFKATPYVY